VYLEITGYFPEDHEDDFIAEVVGELPLSIAQIRRIGRVIQQPLPENLDLFIGVRA
jgi:hypothetical protein